MTLDVVNAENKKVGALELNDDVFGGRVPTADAVVLNAADRQVRPFVISDVNLLPSRYFDYYLDVTRTIDRFLRDASGWPG